MHAGSKLISMPMSGIAWHSGNLCSDHVVHVITSFPGSMIVNFTAQQGQVAYHLGNVSADNCSQIGRGAHFMLQDRPGQAFRHVEEILHKHNMIKAFKAMNQRLLEAYNDLADQCSQM